MLAAFRPATEPVPVETAAGRLADLGFLAGPDLPDRPGPGYLLVALRARPTLRHYDPERVEFWGIAKGHGVRRALTRATPMRSTPRSPGGRSASWTASPSATSS